MGVPGTHDPRSRSPTPPSCGHGMPPVVGASTAPRYSSNAPRRPTAPVGHRTRRTPKTHRDRGVVERIRAGGHERWPRGSLRQRNGVASPAVAVGNWLHADGRDGCCSAGEGVAGRWRGVSDGVWARTVHSEPDGCWRFLGVVSVRRPLPRRQLAPGPTTLGRSSSWPLTSRCGAMRSMGR